MNRQYESDPRQAQRSDTEHEMTPRPVYIRDDYQGSGKLQDKVALITGGDSGIGRAVAIHFAREGADVVIVYHSQDEDARETERLITSAGGNCLALRGDVGDEDFCQRCVTDTLSRFKRLDILVNNAAEQHPREHPEEISGEQMRQTFKTNFFGYFYMVQAALPHLNDGGCIINTTSVTAYVGNDRLIDYSATKGAIVAFTRSLSAALLKERNIRVNGVAPGPIWTPLIAKTETPENIKGFGTDTPMGRPGQPAEVASCYVFLASQDASYMSGQILHPNGGSYIST
jgi:NAD(P)-dependent dehydrogenase (short-subunit alcohol dehydrogenase family)